MRNGTLVAAMAVLAVACSACSGSSHSSGVGDGASTGVGPVPAIPKPGAAGAGWTVYHGDAEASGVEAAPTRLLPSRAAWSSPALDGQLYGEPLVADGRVVAAGAGGNGLVAS